MLHLFSIFHLNLAYSSIEEAQRPDVVRRCYWPLLRLAERTGSPVGIEATAYTLEAAAAIDPAWLDALGALVASGRCEFVGSGYAQVIGPLVPAAVNAANLRLGNLAYERLLGFRPRLASRPATSYSSRMQGRKIVLIVGGGIAAYKACELVRLIRKAGGSVRCVLTAGGAQFITRNTPMGRPGELRELDGALLFLAGPASSYVTGQILAVDGGWLAR